MRCVAPVRPGPPEVLEVVERPVPRPGAGEVLIRVAAAGLNRLDLLQREGRYALPPGAPDVLGVEASGTVVEAGPGAEGFAVGERVCALLTGGGYAEYCVAPAGQCLPVPAGVSLVEAAALPEALFTVWSTVWHSAQLAPGETLLVHGGASGIGTTAIQMAAALGHPVFVTAGSEARCAACRELGAALAVDHRQQDFVAAVRQATGGRGVDVVVDMVGGDYVARNVQAMADGGRLVFISSMGGREGCFDVRDVILRRLTITSFSLRPRTREFKAGIARALRERIWPLVASRRIRPVIDSTFAFADVVAAHRRLESGAHVGKVVLLVDEAATAENPPGA